MPPNSNSPSRHAPKRGNKDDFQHHAKSQAHSNLVVKRKTLRNSIFAAISTVAFAQSSSAADITWSGGGANAGWLTTGNWVGGVVPANSTTTDNAIFTSTSPIGYSIYLGSGNRSISQITFNSETSYNINLYDSNLTTSRELQLGNAGIKVEAGHHTITGADGGSGTTGYLNLSSSTFDIAEGTSLTLAARIKKDDAADQYNKIGSGTLVLKANNGGTGGWFYGSGGLFTVSAGTLELAASGATGNSGHRFTVSSGATMKLSASGAFGAVNANLTLNGTGAGGVGALHASATASINSGTGSIVLATNSRVGVDANRVLTLNQNLTGSGGLEKSGDGILSLSSATNSYGGTTTVTAGVLEITGAGSINSSSGVTVSSGARLVYNSSTALTTTLTLSGNGIGNRAVLGGTGPISQALTLNNVGDVLSPGNSPGIQSYTVAQSWNSFSYDWEVNDFTGTTAGTAFDRITVAGSLALTGGSGSYILNLLSLTSANVAGDAPNFNEIDRSWNILATTGGITGFNASAWQINATGFTNNEAGLWSLASDGNNLVLSYTAIPEPAAALLGGIGTLLLLRRRR
jgi:autotransporter-associated beta strand protein